MQLEGSESCTGQDKTRRHRWAEGRASPRCSYIVPDVQWDPLVRDSREEYPFKDSYSQGETSLPAPTLSKDKRAVRFVRGCVRPVMSANFGTAN